MPARTRRISRSVARLDERGYVINGRKVWVANAEAADLLIVFAATQPGIRGRGVSAFLVPMDTPGINALDAEDSLGVRGLGCMDLELRTCALARTRCSGTRATVSDRDVGARRRPGRDRGAGARRWQGCAPGSARHAKSREAFGQPIGNYQAIQWMLADMATELDAARMLTMKAADSRQRGARPTSTRRWRSCSRRRPRIAPPTRRCRFSRRKVTAAARWSNGCSATFAPRRSTRGPQKFSGWSSPSNSVDDPSRR